MIQPGRPASRQTQSGIAAKTALNNKQFPHNILYSSILRLIAPQLRPKGGIITCGRTGIPAASYEIKRNPAIIGL
jgi:hypothetical protein